MTTRKIDVTKSWKGINKILLVKFPSFNFVISICIENRETIFPDCISKTNCYDINKNYILIVSSLSKDPGTGICCFTNPSTSNKSSSISMQ